MAVFGRAVVLRSSFVVSAFVLAACASAETEREEPREDVASTASALDISVFSLPPASATTRAQILAKYASLDPKKEVPRGLLEDAIVFFDQNQAHIPKKDWLVVVDFKPHSGKDRFFMVNMKTGTVERHKVAHGDGTDPNNDGIADVFGNVDGSHMSSLGYYLTGEIYDGTHVHSMRLDGLSADGSPNGMANTNVRSRLVVVHEASYVDDGNTGQQGRSNGCLALDPSIEVSVVDRIHDGTLIYAAISPLHTPVGPGSTGTGGSAGSAGAGGGSAGSAGKPTGTAGSAGTGAGTGTGGSASAGSPGAAGGAGSPAGQGGAVGGAGSPPAGAGGDPSGSAGAPVGSAGDPSGGGSTNAGGGSPAEAGGAAGSPGASGSGSGGATMVQLDAQSSEGSCAVSSGRTSSTGLWLTAGLCAALAVRAGRGRRGRKQNC